MPTKSGLIDIHLYVSPEEHEKWEEEKKIKYNGLRAMSQMIRNYVNEGIARDRAERENKAK